VWCSLWGTDWILKYYLDELRLQRVSWLFQCSRRAVVVTVCCRRHLSLLTCSCFTPQTLASQALQSESQLRHKPPVLFCAIYCHHCLQILIVYTSRTLCRRHPRFRINGIFPCTQNGCWYVDKKSGMWSFVLTHHQSVLSPSCETVFEVRFVVCKRSLNSVHINYKGVQYLEDKNIVTNKRRFCFTMEVYYVQSCLLGWAGVV
jgi:hypothetical protein